MKDNDSHGSDSVIIDTLDADFAAANLLISNRGILQIADFGLARPYDEPPPQRKQYGREAMRDYTSL
ncbi:P-TEFb-associated cyclin-dependent protein kinase Cdk9, partial [Ascosphaera acerosa]